MIEINGFAEIEMKEIFDHFDKEDTNFSDYLQKVFDIITAIK